ncbi:hypothetical protein BHE74_00040895, partial [Ensete ventricosum]
SDQHRQRTDQISEVEHICCGVDHVEESYIFVLGASASTGSVIESVHCNVRKRRGCCCSGEDAVLLLLQRRGGGDVVASATAVPANQQGSCAAAAAIAVGEKRKL